MLNLKKSLILILISTIIASCSTANPFVNTGRGVTEVEGIDFPEIGKVTIGSLGDTLVSKGTKSYTPAITVLDECVFANTVDVSTCVITLACLIIPVFLIGPHK